MGARFAVAIVALALLAGACVAQASPLPIQGLNGVLELPAAKGTTVWTLGQDCISIDPSGWQATRSRTRNTSTFIQLGTGTVGSVDGVARTGEVHEKNDLALSFHNYNVRPDRVLEVRDLGVDMRGGRAYLTGRVVKGKPTFAAAKRIRLATIAHPSFVSGNATVPGHPSQTRPDTFLMAIQGKATLAAPLAAALNRIRCHPNKFFAIHPRPVRPGLRFGFVSIQLEPGAAVGVAGVVGTSPDFETADETPVTTVPIAPATQGKTGIGLPLMDGTHTPMTCKYGGLCHPTADAQLAADGGYTVSANGRSATIDTISVRFVSGDAVLAGHLNGQQMDLTGPQFLQALSDALGVSVVGAHFDPVVTFTKLTAG
jgi:hypothetical protein